MSLARYRTQGQPQQKIRAEHLDRAAVVYVRQSTRHQVLEHAESTRLQYALAERAVALGLARSQVVGDRRRPGVSAAMADSRKGFARLVAEVTMGRAGVVLGIEMSRLARTGRDWHQLLGAWLMSPGWSGWRRFRGRGSSRTPRVGSRKMVPAFLQWPNRERRAVRVWRRLLAGRGRVAVMMSAVVTSRRWT